MYQVKRKDESVVVMKNGVEEIFSAPEHGSIVYEDHSMGGMIICRKVSELNDDQLLVALASLVSLPRVVR